MSQSVCILGMGLSGAAAARCVLERGDEVTIYAGGKNAKTLATAQPFIDKGVPVFFDTEDVEGHYDLCVVSPGIPQVSAFYQSALAASDKLISEPELAWSISPQNWVAVTGTNGKTTTTALIAHLLDECADGALACGNTQQITTLAAAGMRPAGAYICAEVSSFQLASTVDFKPRAAVLLNITSDHLAWHGGQQAYAEAKLKVFANLGKGQTAVITEEVPSFDEVVASLRSRGVRVVTVGARRSADCAYLSDDGVLVYVDGSCTAHELVAASALQIKGAHNVENALCAASVALDLGCAIDDVRASLLTFAPLEHRIEPAGEVAGIAFFDDSKATNTDATVKALTAFPGRKVVLLLGGRDKGTSLDELVADCAATCSAVVCYGEGGQRFYDAFEDSPVKRELVAGMRDAFALACRLAHPGEVVLLSPACASFDEFSGFVERGNVFKQLVRDFAAQQE